MRTRNQKRDQVLSLLTDRLLAAEAELALLKAAADAANQERESRDAEPVPSGMYL